MLCNLCLGALRLVVQAQALFAAEADWLLLRLIELLVQSLTGGCSQAQQCLHELGCEFLQNHISEEQQLQ